MLIRFQFAWTAICSFIITALENIEELSILNLNFIYKALSYTCDSNTFSKPLLSDPKIYTPRNVSKTINKGQYCLRIFTFVKKNQFFFYKFALFAFIDEVTATKILCAQDSQENSYYKELVDLAIFKHSIVLLKIRETIS